MVSIPDYLQGQTEEEIRARMLGNISSNVDKIEGSFHYDTIEPAAIELALASVLIGETYRRGFPIKAASTIAGEITDELTYRAEERGVYRKAATYATGTITINGIAGTVIAAGYRGGTPVVGTTPSVVFETTADATIGAGGSIDVPIECLTAGKIGIVAAGTITIIYGYSDGSKVAGVTSITNTSPTVDGADEEDDISLLARYLQKVRSPSAGGNKADYVNWAMEVSGVGGVSVIPVRDGPGTVSIAIIDTNKTPASQTLVDTTQNYIAPPWTHTIEAETMTQSGSGVSIDATQTDDSGDSIKMVYDAAGTGTITLSLTLDKPGIWTARPKIKVDAISGSTDLLQIGIWDTVAAAWAKQSPSSTDDAMITLKASDLSTGFIEKVLDFYWAGSNALELRITRQQTDTTTTVWVDQVRIISTFSTDTGDGKAPIGAVVTVEPAQAVQITVAVSGVVIASGYDPVRTKATSEANIDAYVKSLAFQSDNDVRYVRISQMILDTAGILDFTGLTVNGGTANIPVGDQGVAVLSGVNWT